MNRRAEIVGAGFAGLVVATALAQRGWAVQVHERAAELRAFGAGIFIWENGLRVLEAVGAREAAVSRAHEAPQYRLRGPDNEDEGAEVFGSALGTRMVTMTRQSLHSAILAAALASGVRPRLNSHVVAAEAGGTIRTADGQSFSADLVVGADGVNSNVRDSLGLLDRRMKEPWGAIRLLVPRKPGDDDCVVTYRSRSPRRTLYVPCDDQSLYLCFTTTSEDQAGQRLPFDHQEWGGAFPHLRPLFDRIEGQGRWDLYETIAVRSWRKGCVAIIGDAAHGMTPSLGQGAGCAMMNGLSLAEFVQADADIASALQAWEQAERPLTEHTQLYAQALTRETMRVKASNGTKWTDDALRAARHHPRGAPRIDARTIS